MVKFFRFSLMKSIFVLVFLVFFMGFNLDVQAQELNAKVEILAPQVPNANKRVMDLIQKLSTEFLNNRSWTGKKVLNSERIDCHFVITIQTWDGASEYTAQAQIVSARPVYESTYTSPVLRLMDKNFDFSYAEGQVLEYSDRQFMNNLTSLLAYYAYIIVGMDADTFGLNAGDPYFSKATDIANNAQQSSFKGWSSFDGNENRYWLTSNLTNSKYAVLRDFTYQYHRFGLDQLASKPLEAKEVLKNVLPELKKVDRLGQGSMLDQIFFTTKATELAGVYSGLLHQDRMKAYNLLVEIDPANTNSYESLRNQ